VKSLNFVVEKHLYVVTAVLHGRNTWDCPLELFEALGDCPLIGSSYKVYDRPNFSRNMSSTPGIYVWWSQEIVS
jgi:hypothetical protein